MTVVPLLDARNANALTLAVPMPCIEPGVLLSELMTTLAVSLRSGHLLPDEVRRVPLSVPLPALVLRASPTGPPAVRESVGVLRRVLVPIHAVRLCDSPASHVLVLRDGL